MEAKAKLKEMEATMSNMHPIQAHQLWQQTAERVKDKVIAPTLYRALELGVGITVEGDEFVLGYSSSDLPMSSHLRSSQYMSLIEQCLSEVMKQKMRLKIIEGTTLDDYENYKKMLNMTYTTQATMSERREKERAIELAWEEVAEKITRGYAKLPMRQFAQSRAQFMKFAFGVINEAVNRFEYSDASDEIHKRALGRIFEKFATVIESPSTLLAYEFFKLREEGKLK